MKCKHCQTQLEEGCKVCPKCGEAVGAAEEKLLKVSPGKFAFTVAACVVLVAVLTALVLGGMKKAEVNTQTTTTATTAPAVSVPAEPVTEPATIPGDTGKDDVTCKGSYSAEDAEVLANKDTVIATVGGKNLTNGQLQVYYWMYVHQFMDSEMGYYASYIGLDITKPLDQQVCYYDATMTWQQYFLQQALNSWYSYQALAVEAEAVGHKLEEDYRKELDELPNVLEESAKSQGFASADEMLQKLVGPGADTDMFVEYETVYYESMSYYYAESDKMIPTDDEAKAFFAEHEEEYAANGLSKDTKNVNVRHILILPEGATIENIYQETFSEEAWASAEKKAQDLLNQWKNSGMKEEKFAELANANSADPGSNTNGGLYTDVYEGQMMEEFNAWCFDASRKTGDSGIVRTAAGYHVMYFVGDSILWMEYAKSDLLTERQNEMIEKIMEKYPIEVDYDAICLPNVALS